MKLIPFFIFILIKLFAVYLTLSLAVADCTIAPRYKIGMKKRTDGRG